jgi:hypothetical protein
MLYYIVYSARLERSEISGEKKKKKMVVGKRQNYTYRACSRCTSTLLKNRSVRII